MNKQKWEENKSKKVNYFSKEDNVGNKVEINVELYGSHDFREWVTIVAPTEDTEGISERICSTCNKKKTKVVEKLAKVEEPKQETPAETKSSTTIKE